MTPIPVGRVGRAKEKKRGGHDAGERRGGYKKACIRLLERERGKDSGHPVNFPYNQYQKVLLARDACLKGSRPDTL